MLTGETEQCISVLHWKHSMALAQCIHRHEAFLVDSCLNTWNASHPNYFWVHVPYLVNAELGCV